MHWIGYALDRLDASKEKFNELEDKAIEKLITVRKGTRKKKKRKCENTTRNSELLGNTKQSNVNVTRGTERVGRIKSNG